MIRSRFGAEVEAAAAGKLASWRQGYDALAAVILQDQFTRSICLSTLDLQASVRKNMLNYSIWLDTLMAVTRP